MPLDPQVKEELEMLAAFKQHCHLTFRTEQGGIAAVRTRITGLFAEEEDAFLLTEDGQRLSLDKLISINGRDLQHWV